MQKLKYILLRAIHITGLTFLEPVVRLGYGEEPRLQLQKIGRFIVIPMLTFALFLWSWSLIAPVYKTKSGEVPTPAVVYDATLGINRFHLRETEKQQAYLMHEADRQAELNAVNAKLAVLREQKQAAAEQVARAEQFQQEQRNQQLAPMQNEMKNVRAKLTAVARQREAELHQQAENISPLDLSGRNQLLTTLRNHEQLSAAEAQVLSQLEKREREIRDKKSLAVAAAIKHQTELAESEQHLMKKQELLTRNNRDAKLQEEFAALASLKKAYLKASGEQLIVIGRQMLQLETRIHKLAESEYAKPWTLPMQIVRSVVCVFAGFLLATVIAIPIGILCGISPTFMAAVTPFIALFKPVSPIVWLPISLIIVGGVITDPERHWLMVLLSDLPLIGWLKINPAFIASAITVALCSLWPTLVNTALGVASIDKDHLNVARVLRLSFTQRLFKIVIPSALPLIFAGLRISLGVGWMVLIAAELLSSSEGIGKFVWDMFNNGSSETFAQMFVVVFVVGLIGLLLDRTMIVLQRLVSFDGAPAAI